MIEYVKRLAGPFTSEGQSRLPFGFLIFEKTDVYVATADDPEAQAKMLVYGQDYSVEMNADQTATPGGTVVLTTPIVKGNIFVVGSAVAYTQNMQLTNFSRFPPEIINESLDRIVVQIQQLVELTGRTISLPPTSNLTVSEFLDNLFNAAKSAAKSAEEAKKFAQICEEIKQNIFIYSWDIPHVVDTLDDVEKYPYDGFFAVGGYGDPGHHGQDISNRFVKARGSTELRTLGERFSDVVNVKDFGAKGDGVTDDTSAFISASEKSSTVFVPAGEYLITSVPSAYLFTLGGGKIVINGQTFSLSSYPQRLAVLEQIEVDGTAVRMSNLSIGQDAGLSMKNSDAVYANLAIGTSAAEFADNIIRVTAVGQYSARELVKGYSVTAIGANACEWTDYADRCCLIGDNAGKNLGSATVSGRHGYFIGSGGYPAEFDTRWPEWRTYAGAADSPAEVMTAEDFSTKATHVVGIGRNSFGFSVTTRDSVGVGYDSCTSLLYGTDCVGIGDRVMQWTIKGLYSTFVGSKAAQGLMDSAQDTAVGYQTLSSYVHSFRNTVVGYQALAGFNCNHTDTPTGNSFFGRIAGANASGNIANNAGFGAGTLSVVTGNGNTALGTSALTRLVTGDNNTAVGLNALILMQDSSNATALNNATGIGYQARVSGDNQVQLGNSATTTYAYGAVQDRSDRRDKADIHDTKLGSDFILSLRPVDFRWDYRDDYVEEVDDGVDEEGNPLSHVVIHEKDGSKKRNRFHHGFIAQEVKETMDRLGIDFGGYQDHSINGGNDVKSLGYQELIAPMVKTIQEMDMRIKALEAKEDK